MPKLTQPSQPLYNKYHQPIGSPADKVTNPLQTKVPWQWGVEQHIQSKKIITSKLQTKTFNFGTLSGTTIITSGSIQSSGSFVASGVLGTMTLSPNGLVIQSGTNNGTVINLFNTGGTSVYQLFLSNNFAHEIVNEIDFASNTSNKFIEHFGPVARLADAVGGNAFRVQDSTNTDRYAFYSNGEFEFNQLATSPSAGTGDQVRLYTSTTGGKHQLLVYWPGGAIGTIATEP